MSEKIPTCQIHDKYGSIICSNPALDGDPQGLCILHSQNLDKNQEEFRKALQKRWRDREDRGSLDFRGVFFPGSFGPRDFFDTSEFNKPADFSAATFREEANFSGATFSNATTFIGTTFSNEVNFRGETFSGKIAFIANTFSKKVDFSSVLISEDKEVYFRGTDFPEKEGVIFRGAKIFGKLIFEQINLPDNKKKNRSWHGDFIRLDLGQNAILRFRNVSLSLVRFEGTDLKKIEFENVEWYKLLSRQAVFEEINLGKNLSSSKFALIEKIYRELKINYKNQEDYKRFGVFHYGEMEMHRKASFWRRRIPFSWYNLYWALSGYGERPSRALGWLGGFLLALPLFIWGFGLDRGAGGTPPGFLETLTYIFEKATFQRPPQLSNLNLLGSFISNLSVLIIPGQAALFLLALRNRLGRRR